MKSFNGYTAFVQQANGMVITEWVEYPKAVKISKWVCFLALIGIALAFLGSFVPAYQAYGWVGVWYAVTNITNVVVFLPITVLCILGLYLKG